MITFGIIEVLFSQIPDFDQVWWLSIVAAVMSFTYSFVGLGLGIGKVAGRYLTQVKSFINCQSVYTPCTKNLNASLCVHMPRSKNESPILLLDINFLPKLIGNRSFKGSLTGISIGTVTHAGTVTETQKLWRGMQALGAIAFAYSYSIILIEIQVHIFPYLNFCKVTYFD